MAERLLSVVTSSPSPQPGQEHRSSGNFTTEGAPAGTSRLRWEIRGRNKSHIRFDVRTDVSNDDDSVKFANLSHKATTSYRSVRSLYIADPSDAPAPFIVRVYAIF